MLFSCSILENICYGKTGLTAAQVKEAAKAANAHQFITDLGNQVHDDENVLAKQDSDSRFAQLPTGYRIKCGSRGSKVSGGQKQRIAIARAIIRNPNILMLDEATSALDEEAQREVQAALDEIMVGRTSIVVAHRLSTLKNCHKVVQMAEGIIVKEGSFEDIFA